MRVPVLIVAATALVAVGATACSSSSQPSAATVSTPAVSAVSTPVAASSSPTAASSPAAAAGDSSAPSGGAGGVRIDGAYSGSLKVVACVGTGKNTTVAVTADFGSRGSGYQGNIAANELGFQGPDQTDFDSGYLKTTLDQDGKGFNLEGMKLQDTGGTKVVTLHGKLRCP